MATVRAEIPAGCASELRRLNSTKIPTRLECSCRSTPNTNCHDSNVIDEHASCSSWEGLTDAVYRDGTVLQDLSRAGKAATPFYRLGLRP